METTITWGEDFDVSKLASGTRLNVYHHTLKEWLVGEVVEEREKEVLVGFVGRELKREWYFKKTKNPDDYISLGEEQGRRERKKD